MKPHIEYHINVFHQVTWGEHYESHPVCTTFAAVIANGWAWAEKVVPMRLRWTSWAWPGGYEIHYVTKDGGVLCHKCANDNLDLTLGDDPQWQVVDQDINYETGGRLCDHCNAEIGPEYGGDDDQVDATQSPA